MPAFKYSSKTRNKKPFQGKRFKLESIPVKIHEYRTPYATWIETPYNPNGKYIMHHNDPNALSNYTNQKPPKDAIKTVKEIQHFEVYVPA